MANESTSVSVLSAVGRLEKVRKHFSLFGLPYSQEWSEKYEFICDAIENKRTADAKLLLMNGYGVNNKNKYTNTPGNTTHVFMINTPLLFAVINGDIEIVKMLLDGGSDIHVQDEHGNSLLHNAIENKEMEIIELLLNRGANVDVKDCCGLTPLHIATKKENVEIIELLLQFGANINSKCDFSIRTDYTPLHFAAEKGNEEIIKLLLSRGANVEAKGKDGTTPLHVAVVKGPIQNVDYLLKHGACINSTYGGGFTSLMHIAAERNNEELIKLLLSSNAHVDGNAKDCVTPLFIAVGYEHEKVIKLLLEHGANVDTQHKNGETVLSFAIQKRNSVIVEHILKYGPNVNNQSNRSSFYNAVMYGYGLENINITKSLLRYGFTVNVEDVNNCELLFIAVEKGYLKIVEDLLRYGADVNTLCNKNNKKGYTLLHNATENKQEEVATLLINFGADVNAKDSTEKTPLCYAIENSDLKITQLLLDNGANVHSDVNKNVESPLHLSAQIGNALITKMLLNKGANVNVKKYNGAPLYIASVYGNKEVVEVLLKCDAKFDDFHHNMTPFHVAVFKKDTELVEIFLKFGVDIDSRDKFGRTALYIASEAGYKDIVVTLLENGSDLNFTSESENNYTPLQIALESLDSYRFEYMMYNNDRFYNEIYCCQKIIEILKKRIVMMKTANLYVSEENLKLSGCNDELSDFQGECEEEMKRIRSEKISNNIYFHDILLTKSVNQLVTYARNENIVAVLKSYNYKTRFPIYSSMINSYFRKGMERKELLEQCYKCFHLLFNIFAELPYNCTEKILNYLSNKKLRILIASCKTTDANNSEQFLLNNT